MTRAAVIRELRKLVAEAGGPVDWANAHGMRGAYVYMVLNGTRSPGPKILDALGLEKVVPEESYRRRQAAE